MAPNEDLLREAAKEDGTTTAEAAARIAERGSAEEAFSTMTVYDEDGGEIDKGSLAVGAPLEPDAQVETDEGTATGENYQP